MTIEVTITNADSRDSAVIAVKSQTPDGEPYLGSREIELKGGESTSQYIHDGRRLVVEEVRQ